MKKKIVAVTSCPTGIAHTYMAAEALQMAAKKMGVEIKVETQGSVGAENVITSEDLREAHAVILACDTKIDEERFAGLPILKASVQDAIKNAESLIQKALNMERKNFVDEVYKVKSERKEKAKGVYKHLMTGVSHMIPFVVAGGILIAISFAFGIRAFEQEGSFAAALMEIGGNAAFSLMVPILAGFIAFSIADRPGLAPGMIGGLLASRIGAGFLGGIAAGFGAGYLTAWLKKTIKLPKSLEGLKPVLIIPVLSTLIVGLGMLYVVGKPVAALNSSLTSWLNSMNDTSMVLLGILLGLMMAFDMGGPVNKAAYTFAVSTLSSGQPSVVMAAVMAAGMTPPLGVALATILAKDKFTTEEREAGKAAFFLGLSFITEGAIPFAAADPIRVIPSIMAGSAVASVLSMLFGCTLAVPHGGIFVLPIPNAVSNLFMYLISITAGTLVTALILSTLKPKRSE
ncbi:MULTISPECIES: PTS fructose transporter subunit IIC [unclassified Thermotoga]|jgi:PTS system fructose-specific IIC component|uniref:PTS fructose transporter subunit IIBC n=1 Tax=Fervidobacterium pennivorans TaxID=93466 RepID=A0A7V4KCP6_FERPE|nr:MULTISPECIES: fructose-specific PTS transporter subunit EIIC [unclassified Thermotoga]ACB08992.1 PTS system, fructose subfamily, IIC subunit [Thermotoga sp. RQ2]AIY86201.1 PTS system fructose subfamily transporter subunit IIC [Thermotoga sp. 2812B]EJX26136.1 PTS system fructose subfamily transporter subunit IIC [Thermotoga sp. EMP]KAF2959477.1 PTS fructose transporter subunit IIBC [Thermotoga sp. 38H-to]